MTEDRQKLFDFWNSIPAMKFIDVDKKIYGKQPIRRAIIRILLEGTMDEFPDKPARKRRALNVNEIEHLLKLYFKNEKDKEEKITITRTKLYFHLNLLEEAGMISVVATILEGPHKRNKTKYYGRASRSLFITDQEMSLKQYQTRFEEYEKLANLIGIELPQNFSKLPKEILETDQKRYTKLAKWLSKHEILIDENNIDFSEVFEFMKYMDRINSDHIKILDQLHNSFHKELEK